MFIVAIGCSSTKTATVDVQSIRVPNKRQVWQLVEMKGRAMPQSGKVFTLTLNSEAATLRGETPCNRYFADMTLQVAATTAEATRYRLGQRNLGHGDVQCPEADMEQEKRYFALFARCTEMELGDHTLCLLQKGNVVLKYELQ